MNWELLLKKAEKYYYSEFAMALMSLLVIFLYATKRYRSKKLKPLAILSIFSFIQTALVDLYSMELTHASWEKNIYKDSMYPYIIIELMCCLFFLKAHLRSVVTGKIISWAILFFSLYTATYWICDFQDFYFPLHISLMESLLVISSCFYFFYELFFKSGRRNPFAEPAFWAASGMLLLFSIITPIFLFYNYLKKVALPFAQHLYVINFGAYTIMFITFAIAIRLNKTTIEPNS